MIIWIASYPRSGNALFLSWLFHLHGIYHYSIYEKTSCNLSVGLKPLPCSLHEMHHAKEIFFIKTHELPEDNNSAIYLLRDARDTLISYAHYIQDFELDTNYDQDYEKILETLITQNTFFNGWSKHILTWTQRKDPTLILRFEYLIQHSQPQEIIKHIFNVFDLGQLPDLPNSKLPVFQELHLVNPKYYRSGTSGQWKAEMSQELQDLCWKHHGYALSKMGYSRHHVFLSIGLEFFDILSSQSNTQTPIPEPKPISEPELISTLISELRAKEATIQNQLFFLKLSPAYWITIHLTPFLKRILGKRIVIAVRRRKNYLSLEPQFKPRPLQLPPSYFHFDYSEHAIEHPRISIVTPSYNQAQYISQTIESILNQGYPNLEYVIQDAASTDGTLEIIQSHAERITHIQSEPDFGQAHGINLGFQKTTGKIMAWLNADDLLLPGSLNYVAQFFHEHPDVDVVYSHRILINEQGDEIGRWILPPHDDEMLSWADYIPQETLFWRRKVWDEVGGHLDQSYQFAMDWELLLRFRAAGAKFARLPRFLGAFRVHAQQKTQAAYSIGEQEMKRLRWILHGDSISQFQVDQKIKKYLKRASCYRVLQSLNLPENLLNIVFR